MAAYVQALRNMRKQLEKSTPVEEPAAPAQRGGILSSQPVQQAQRQTQQTSQLTYEPAKFVMNGMREMGLSRERMRMALAQVKENQARIDAQKKEKTIVVKEAPKEEGPAMEETKGLVKRPADGPKGKEVYTRQMPGNTDVAKDTAFIEKARGLAEKYNVPLSHLMSVMHFETGGTFDPAQKNLGGSSGTGLIQFMRATAEEMGTSTQALAAMSRNEQLDWVDKYFKKWGLDKVENPTGADLYMTVLHPRGIGKPDDYILWKEGTLEYDRNRGLDVTGKGYVTKADAARKAMQFIDAYGEL